MWVIDALRNGVPALVVEVCQWCRVVFSRTRGLTNPLNVMWSNKEERGSHIITGNTFTVRG